MNELYYIHNSLAKVKTVKLGRLKWLGHKFEMCPEKMFQCTVPIFDRQAEQNHDKCRAVLQLGRGSIHGLPEYRYTTC
jgi:hypothetical protein